MDGVCDRHGRGGEVRKAYRFRPPYSPKRKSGKGPSNKTDGDPVMSVLSEFCWCWVNSDVWPL
jgi:hypothetical protein